jgi:hypothetical protein
VERYPWIPDDYVALAETTRSAVHPGGGAWFLTVQDYSGTSDSAFRWNEWELLSAECCDGDSRWQAEIVSFWDRHFPIMMSVGKGYAYWALERETLAVVGGTEPEFEDTSIVASSVASMANRIAAGDPALVGWL